MNQKHKLQLIIMACIMIGIVFLRPMSAFGDMMLLSAFAEGEVSEDKVTGDIRYNGWIVHNEKTFYYKDNNYVTGLNKIDGKSYYFNDNGVMQTGWVKDGQHFYHLDDEGVRDSNAKKIYKINGKRYYLSKSGKAYKGWQTIGDKTYYFDTKNYAAATGITKIGANIYGFTDQGALYQSGWEKIGKDKYYFSKDDGHAMTGIQRIAKKLYTFSTDGILKTTLDDEDKMAHKAYDMSSKTKYLILVNCTTHRCGVYTGSKNNWKELYYWQCGDGKPSTPTILGTFETGQHDMHNYKAEYFDLYGDRCWYSTRIIGSFLFHSVTYVPSSKPNKIRDGRVGAGVSHGCVRLDIQNAKWIYDHIPEETKVKIYK